MQHRNPSVIAPATQDAAAQPNSNAAPANPPPGANQAAPNTTVPPVTVTPKEALPKEKYPYLMQNPPNTVQQNTEHSTLPTKHEPYWQSPTPAGFPFGAPTGSYAPIGAGPSGPTPGWLSKPVQP
jgi:hypothetical protein